MVSIVSRSDDEDVPLSKVVPKQESDAGQAADTKQNDTIVQTDNGTREEGSKKKKKEKKRKAEESGKGVAAGKKAEGDGAQKRVRKVFDKPGQTRETPPEEDPQRRFYTSLLEQNPKSEMAQKWKRSADGKSPANKKKKKKEGSEVEKKKAKKTQKAQYKEEVISSDSDQEIIPKKKKRTPLPEGAARPVGRDAVRFDDEDV
eukprot:jgi/Picre1/28895/NNA_004291.t1